MIIDSFLKLVHDPAASALVGAVLGAVLTLIVGYVIEYWKDTRFKKRVRNFVNTELEFYQDFLNKLLTRGRENNGNLEFDNGTENIRWINQIMPLPIKKINSESYAKLTAETKSRVFDIETTIALNDVYRSIDYFQYRDVEHNGTIWRLFTKAEVDRILVEIKKAKNLLNHSFKMCHCLKSTDTTESDSDKLAKRLTWRSFALGAFVAIGTAYLGAGIGVVATVYTILPNLTGNDAAKSAQILNSLSSFMLENFLIGGSLIGLGVLLGWLAIVKAKR